MANAGKVLALIGAIFTILGTFFFTLFQFFGGYVYGAGGMFNIDELFAYTTSGNPDAWIAWIAGPLLILYLLSGFIQLLGIKSRIAAFFGSLLPIAVATIVIISLAGVTNQIVLWLVWLTATPLVPNIIPITFEYSFMNFGFGTIIIAVGGLLALLSVFMSREN